MLAFSCCVHLRRKKLIRYLYSGEIPVEIIPGAQEESEEAYGEVRKPAFFCFTAEGEGGEGGSVYFSCIYLVLSAVYVFLAERSIAFAARAWD